MTDPAEYLDEAGARISYRRSEGDPGRAGVVWLGGFHSDMLGEKASVLHAACREAGRSFVRFDYLGHGESGGAFADGTIGRWRSDALAMLDQFLSGQVSLNAAVNRVQYLGAEPAPPGLGFSAAVSAANRFTSAGNQRMKNSSGEMSAGGLRGTVFSDQRRGEPI